MRDAVFATLNDWRCARKPGRRRRVASVVVTLALLLAAGFRVFGPLSARGEISPHAVVGRVAPGEAQWTEGFWGNRFETCRQQTIPGLWRLMEGTNYTHFYQNFCIAAGLAEGRSRGAPFNDGDFYKWLEGACAMLAVTRDPSLDRLIDEVVSVIARAQHADGYLHTPVLIRQRNGDAEARPFQDRLNFEMYNMGHLLTTAALHYRVTGKTNLLAVARKTADFLGDTFRSPTPELARNSVCPSHYMGVIELYRVTHEPRYLELARKFLDLRRFVAEGGDDNQDRLPLDQQTEAVGHAVRANYLYAGAADLIYETGDAALWGPLTAIWTNLVQKKLYVTGGCGSLYDGASPDGAKDQKSITRVHQAYGRNYQLPNLTAHNETCANIGNVLWNWRMFLLTGEARYMDVAELALYNSVLSGVSLDGTNFFYVNPLRQLDPLPVELRWPRVRVPFLSSFCCPPNLARTIAASAGYAYGTSSNAVWVNLFGSSTLATTLAGGQRLKLTQETEYPWSGRVRLTINEYAGPAFGLKVRIPGWAPSATLRVNNTPPEGSPTPGTYCELRRPWRAGDVIQLDFPLPVQRLEANPLVEEALNQVSLKRGPIVYCLESGDLPAGISVREVLLPDDADLIARYDQRLLGGVAVLEGFLTARPAAEWKGQLYREIVPAPPRMVRARFIPYYAWGNRGVPHMTVWMPLLR